MGKTGVANLPLHNGKAPKWLFKRMVQLSKSIIDVMIYEYGVNEFLNKITDPFWFQALSCVLGYDWHSSGTTTVTCGALKEAVDTENNGFAIAGGKGKASRNTHQDIERMGDKFNLSTYAIEELKYASRITAKVDNSAIQDGHNLYHHVIFFTEKRKWAVIQQGLNETTNYARRYHWLSGDINNFVCEPHSSIIGNFYKDKILDMTSTKSISSQEIAVDLVNDNPIHLKRDWAELTRHPNQKTLDCWSSYKKINFNIEYLNMPRGLNWSKMKEIYNFQPENYEKLLSIQGVGPSTVRALALISELIYGEKPSWSDPVKFSFTVGGKDGVPFPVDKKAMDKSTEIIRQSIAQAKLGEKEKINSLRRLRRLIPYT